MNIITIIGFILAIVVLYFGFRLSSEDMTLFIDYVSMFIVLGGTLAAVTISIPLTTVFKLIKVFFQQVIRGKRYKNQQIVTEIIKIAEKYRVTGTVDGLADDVSDFFLKDALLLIQDNILEDRGVIKLITKRNDLLYKNYMVETSRFQTMGKYPPAFGMMGTTIGMIVLLANLGGKDAMKMIGPAMGVCLITTLYGVIVANLAIIPVGEYLEDSNKELYSKNQIIIEGIKLMLEKTNPVVVAENLNSYLIPSERVDWKDIVK